MAKLAEASVSHLTSPDMVHDDMPIVSRETTTRRLKPTHTVSHGHSAAITRHCSLANWPQWWWKEAAQTLKASLANRTDIQCSHLPPFVRLHCTMRSWYGTKQNFTVCCPMHGCLQTYAALWRSFTVLSQYQSVNTKYHQIPQPVSYTHLTLPTILRV